MEDSQHGYGVNRGPAQPGCRRFLAAGLGLAVALSVTRVAAGAPSEAAGESVGDGPIAACNIKADIELIRADEINRAYERVVNKDVRYRFVIDMALQKEGV